MKKGSLVQGVFLICVVFGFSISAQTDESKLFKDKDYKFSVTLPENWIVISPAPPGFRLKLVRSGLENRSDIGIVGTHAPSLAQTSSADFVEQFSKDPSLPESIIRRGNPTAKLIASGKTKVADRDAFFIKSAAIFDTPDGKIDMTVYQVFLLSGGDSFTVTLRAPSTKFDDLFIEFQKMTASFAIGPTVS